MKYLFEKTKNNFTVEEENAFTYLRELVTNLDEKGVKKWFDKENPRMKEKGKENLALSIGNYTYYFSLKTNGYRTEKQIKEIESMKYKILLPHFKLEDQFTILSGELNIEEEIFDLLYKTAKIQKKEKVFYQSRIILDPLTKLYYKENFDKIKKIETIINKNIVDLENPYMAFYYNNGGSYYNLKNNYTMSDEIMLNYSDDKKDFILSYGKVLPSKNKANQLLADIKNNYENRSYITVSDQERIEKITENVKNYKNSFIF